MKRFAALLAVALLGLGLAAAPQAAAYTYRWNLCYADGTGGCTPQSVWSNRNPTWYKPYPRGTGNYIIFQTDCNLVVRNGNMTAAWASNTSWAVKPCNLRWQGDGNVVIYDYYKTPVWATGTNKGGGWTYQFTLRSDNCLYINQGPYTIWTDGRCGV